MLREELRPIRLQLELLKPELTLLDHNIDTTIAFFGSARIPDPDTAHEHLEAAEKAIKQSPNDRACELNLKKAKHKLGLSNYYVEAQKLSYIVSKDAQKEDGLGLVVTSGGGPGIMEAVNRGAHEADAKSISLNIVIPHEQESNPYVTPELNFLFHYFAIRKMHFLIRAQALVAFPGGFGTLDEFFEAITLIQTGKIEPIPLLLFGKSYWSSVINFDALVENGMISESDLDLFHYIETADEAWEIISTELKNKPAE